MSFTKDVEFERRKKIFDSLKRMNRPEQEELYRILRRQGEELSENRSGIFFDVMHLRDDTVAKIEEWITFCSQNRTSFEDREKQMTELEKENHGIRETI
jgi:hypothetical protein